MIDSNNFDFGTELNDDSSSVIDNNQISNFDSCDSTNFDGLGHNPTLNIEIDSFHTCGISHEFGLIGRCLSENTFENEIINSSSVSSPYDSGFDDEHPIPSYKELRNAGFTDFEAKKIIYGDHEMYSDKELYECLYESDDPKASYDAMIKEKTDEMFRKIDDRIARL